MQEQRVPPLWEFPEDVQEAVYDILARALERMAAKMKEQQEQETGRCRSTVLKGLNEDPACTGTTGHVGMVMKALYFGF